MVFWFDWFRYQVILPEYSLFSVLVGLCFHPVDDLQIKTTTVKGDRSGSQNNSLKKTISFESHLVWWAGCFNDSPRLGRPVSQIYLRHACQDEPQRFPWLRWRMASAPREWFFYFSLISRRHPNSRAKSTETRACTAPCLSKKLCRPLIGNIPSCQMFGCM